MDIVDLECGLDLYTRILLVLSIHHSGVDGYLVENRDAY